MSYFKLYFWYSFRNRKFLESWKYRQVSYPLDELLISMLELLVSNIPELDHPPVVTMEGGGVRFWLCPPEPGDTSGPPPPVSESGEPKAGGGFAAFLDFDLDPPLTKVPRTTCICQKEL
jgi:hypothetical protein